MKLVRLAVLVLPALATPRPVGDGRDALARFPAPPAHATDVWLGEGDGVTLAPGAVKEALGRNLLAAGPLNPGTRAASQTVGGMLTVGSVAVLEGDDTTVSLVMTGFGMMHSNLAAVSRRFIAAFGDEYDQIAVFLSFVDRLSQQALAYQLPVKNDVRGIGLGLFDQSQAFGSRGRMQTVLNMKRITLYGRDAADDPDNGLYAVWAQEAAHRWLVYLNYRREGEVRDSQALRGRQNAHWARNVQADASLMDGYLWRDNADDTYTPVERGKRYGALDQYGMGLRAASEVPPFFVLEDLRDEDGQEVKTGPLVRGSRYQGRRIDLTIDDIIRASGKREPSSDAAARDLRMGVVLVGPPGRPPEDLIGEASRIDQTRRLWTEFYDNAGGGRGKVCTELARPCRGEAFTFEQVEIEEAPELAVRDGVVAPGEPAVLRVKVTNVGSEAGVAKVRAAAPGQLTFRAEVTETPLLAPGQAATITIAARASSAATCAKPVAVQLSAPGRLGTSAGQGTVVLGLLPRQLDSLEDAEASTWRVDPDGTDTAQKGRWAVGMPARTTAFDVTLQPGGAFSGSRAFVTGLSGEEIDNVDGRTTLESPAFSIADLREPYLSYQVYFVSADFEQEVLVPAKEGSLRVEASLDGTTWAVIDGMGGIATGWQRRLVRLAAAFDATALRAAQTVRFRFIAEEAAGSGNPVVEAAIDDVGLYGEVPVCALSPEERGTDPEDTGQTNRQRPGGDTGCACRLGLPGRGGGTSALTFPLVLALLLARKRLGRGRRLP
jgi:hypothetical protein